MKENNFIYRIKISEFVQNIFYQMYVCCFMENIFLISVLWLLNIDKYVTRIANTIVLIL